MRATGVIEKEGVTNSEVAVKDERKDPGPDRTSAGAPEPPEEPADEFQVLLVSSGIGLVTGILVVLLNMGVHGIEDLCKQAGSSLGIGSQLGPLLWAPLLGGAGVSAVYLAFGDLQGTALPAIRNLAIADSGAVRAAAGGLAPEDRARRALGRVGLAATTLGTGNSLGPEGPSVEVGANVAAFLGDFASGSWGAQGGRDLRLSLLATGCAAGVAAGFNAPIAGLFFAVELIKPPNGEGEEITVARLLSATFAATAVQIGLGSSPALKGIDFVDTAYLELPLYMLLGALCGVVSAAFAYVRDAAGPAFEGLRKAGVPRWLHPVLGSLVVALAAGGGGLPELTYQGFANINSILLTADKYSAMKLAELLAGKIVLTSACIGAGLVGGVFAPALFMGAVIGALYGQGALALTHSVGVAISPATDYAAVGAAATLAAICNVPLTAVVLLLELTAGTTYAICLPLIAAVSISLYLEAFLRGRIGDKKEDALSRLAMLTPEAEADRIFCLLDKNKDGTVSNEEFKEWFANLGERARELSKISADDKEGKK